MEGGKEEEREEWKKETRMNGKKKKQRYRPAKFLAFETDTFSQITNRSIVHDGLRVKEWD